MGDAQAYYATTDSAVATSLAAAIVASGSLSIVEVDRETFIAKKKIASQRQSRVDNLSPNPVGIPARSLVRDQRNLSAAVKPTAATVIPTVGVTTELLPPMKNMHPPKTVAKDEPIVPVAEPLPAVGGVTEPNPFEAI